MQILIQLCFLLFGLAGSSGHTPADEIPLLSAETPVLHFTYGEQREDNKIGSIREFATDFRMGNWYQMPNDMWRGHCGGQVSFSNTPPNPRRFLPVDLLFVKRQLNL